MTSSGSSQKRTVKASSDIPKDMSGADIFYQLTYMSATAAAGIPRNLVFTLARQLPIPTARCFSEINSLVENMRYSYPDACRMVGDRVNSEDMRTFLLRLSDALSSGEPLANFLAQEARVQGESYSNEYERNLESLKKWNDGYTAVTVSVALIVIINMVSTMIYNLGVTTMLAMVAMAAVMGFGVAWVLSRAAPQEVKNGPLAEGTKKQRLTLRLSRILLPAAVVVSLALALLGVHWGWIFIVASLVLVPVGIASLLADQEITRKDKEISAFFRSLGGTATSRSTTLSEALTSMEIDSFPILKSDIRNLSLRLSTTGNPGLCWHLFGVEAGSKLINRTTGIFYEATNLGGDPERAGVLSSLFSMKTAMLRAKREGIAATFTWLLVIMHAVLAALMVFLLEIVRQFVLMLNESMASLEHSGEAIQSMAMGMFDFGLPQVKFLGTLTTGMILVLALTNAFAIVASEGSHLSKILLYLSILLFLSGLSSLVVPPLVLLVM
jgi:flagellar protein FlaJ